MRIFKTIRPLAYLAVFLVMNACLSFVLEPARGSSELMWKQYYKEKEIDTIFIGSSLCLTSFDPYIFDETMGTKSFNMGTPLQAMPVHWLTPLQWLMRKATTAACFPLPAD